MINRGSLADSSGAQSRRTLLKRAALSSAAAMGSLLLGNEAADAACGGCSNPRCIRSVCYPGGSAVQYAYSCCQEANGICYGTQCWVVPYACSPPGTYDYCR